MDIRIAKKSDLEIIKNITHDTIREIYPHFYPGGVVDFFLNLHSSENILKDIELSNTYLAFCDKEYVGTITINENEISRLFVLPDHQGKGYGTALMDYAEEKIFKSYSEIELHASLSGKKMYIKRGYTEKEYRCKELENGDWICADIMEKMK
ncbi:MAG: GNAT family N-acetyltransferase [Lachnospira sp.]